MADYSITFARSARKKSEQLPNDFIARILAKIDTLSHHPFLKLAKRDREMVLERASLAL